MESQVMKTLDAETFENYVLGFDGIILFHKQNCPNCKVMIKVLAKVISQIDSLKVGCIDSEGNPQIMGKYGISRVPTLLMVKGGEVRNARSGIISVNELVNLYQSV